MRGWRLLLVLGLLAGLAALLWRSFGPSLSLQELAVRQAVLAGFVARHPVSSVALYMAAYTVVVGFSIPGALVMSLAGGLLFGPVEGGIAAVAGVTSGACLMYAAARSALGEALARCLPASALRERLEAAVRRDAFGVLLSLRLMPAAPIVLVNLVAGIVRAPFGAYLAATVLGVAPATFLYAAIGSGLGRVLARGAPSDAAQLLDWRLYLPLVGLALLSAAPLVLRWRRERSAASLPKAAS